MLRKGLWSKRICTSSSSNYLELAVFLDVDHEKTPNAHSYDAGSSTSSHRSSVPYARDLYSSKLIVKWI